MYHRHTCSVGVPTRHRPAHPGSVVTCRNAVLAHWHGVPRAPLTQCFRRSPRPGEQPAWCAVPVRCII